MADALYQRLFEEADKVCEMLQGIPGFVSYTMVKTEGGGYSKVVVEGPEVLADVGRVSGAQIKGIAAEISGIDPPTSYVGPVGVHV